MAESVGDLDSASRARVWMVNLYEFGGRRADAVDGLLECERYEVRHGVEAGRQVMLSGWAALLMVDVGRWVEAEARLGGSQPESGQLRSFMLNAQVALGTARGAFADVKPWAAELAALHNTA